MEASSGRSETFRTSGGTAATKQDDVLMHPRRLCTKYGQPPADVIKLTHNLARRKTYSTIGFHSLPARTLEQSSTYNTN